MKTALKRILKPVLESAAGAFGPHARRASVPHLWLPMYHRVLPQSDPRSREEEPGMLLRPETLEMHIRELRREFELVSLREWVDRWQQGKELPPKACAITFDDGWLDNYECAFPVLKALKAPATIFAVAQKIGTDDRFWPNIVGGLLAGGARAALAAHPTLRASVEGTGDLIDQNVIADVIHRLKIHSDGEIHAALNAIRWRTLLKPTGSRDLMSWTQMREMQASGLIEFGSHTCSHSRLTRLTSQAELHYEIVESKRVLEANLDRPVDLFCFPDGDFNDRALGLVREHYRAAVTTRRGINQQPTLDLHKLGRIGLHEEMSATRTRFRARLSGWI